MAAYQEKVTKVTVGGEEMTFKFGKFAPRAEAAVWAQVGETVVLTVVSMTKNETSELDYFPLTIEYIEKFYAGGVISGSRFTKREGRPSDEATLKARQIDHSIRSLFPKSFKTPVNVIVTVLAYDGQHDPEVLAVTSASMALMLSSIPFFGPSTSLMVGIKGEELIANPTLSKAEGLDGKWIVSQREGRILNIEGWGNEHSEEMMGKILDFAVEQSKPLLDTQIAFTKEAGKEKMPYTELPVAEELINEVKHDYITQVTEAIYNKEKRNEILAGVKKELNEKNAEKYKPNEIDAAVEYVARRVMRDGVLKEGKRSSGRALDEIRELEIEVGLLPRVHGSALFRRGLTQGMSIVTLGSTRLVQSTESFEGEGEKSFMHHYNAPSYSLGEAGRFQYYPGRREIGHGYIAENALKCVLPTQEEFPYTIRVVSEILSQQGSSSMAATCGSSLALMQAGVPIKKQVGGVSLGLVTNDDNMDEYKLLTDMEDVEDFYGDMDFKVTGTAQGVTAVQLDNKLMGVPVKILKQGFMESKVARQKILDAMNAVISEPSKEMSPNAPKVKIVHIDPEKIGGLIGPGGKNIKEIMAQLGDGVDIDIKDDGQVNITAIDPELLARAEELVTQSTFVPAVGQVYKGRVDGLTTFGAFIELAPNLSGLLHVSEMSDRFVKDPKEIVKEGDEVWVKVLKTENGKISLTLKGVDQKK